MVVGIIAIVLGGGWLFSSEPWMLDQHANEVALQISFSELFSHNINSHLPDYLTIIYRFFGWWVITIGLLLTTFVQVTRMGTPLSRKVIHSVLVIMLIGLYTLEISFIPSSPFLWLTHGITILLGMSIWAGTKLRSFDS